LHAKFVVALLVAAAANLAPAQQAPARDWPPAATAWWSHVQYLADDKLQGRRTGTPGYEAAVQYVEGQFKQIGLKPAGTNGYRQNVELVPSQVNREASSFKVDDRAYDLAHIVMLSPHITGDGMVDAPMVFIGYGLSLPRRHIDDLAGIDLKGKVAVFYNAAPENLQGPQRSYARNAAERWKVLKAAGAIGMIAIMPPRPGAPPSPTPAPANGAPLVMPPTLLFANPALETMPGIRVFAMFMPDGAKPLFEGAPSSLDDIKTLAESGKPLPRFALRGTLHAKTVVTTLEHIQSPNVVGELEGSDRKLKKEFVIISAHLDHLGVGRPVDGDTIYNGAMDNASGVASVIESAKILSAGPRPKRSILFIAFTGEELGELGSQYYAMQPTVPQNAIVADLNMDMFLPLFPLRFLEVQGLGESTLGNDARAICQLNDVEVQFDKQPDENRFVRSDQVNFVKQGIPALAFKFGWVPDSPEQKVFNEWVKVRYHRPSDDLQQPVDKVAAAQFTDLLAQLAARVGNAPTRPTWYPESSFATKN